jgi:hypothetical protein
VRLALKRHTRVDYLESPTFPLELASPNDMASLSIRKQCREGSKRYLVFDKDFSSSYN